MFKVFRIKNEDFEVVVVNNSDLKVKSKIYLSGCDVGTLVLKPREYLSLQKPVEGVNRKFRYCQFNSYEAVMGQLNKENLYSDEITAVFMPEKLSKQTQPVYESMNRYDTADSTFDGINVTSDFVGGFDTVDNSVGVVLGPNRCSQNLLELMIGRNAGVTR